MTANEKEYFFPDGGFDLLYKIEEKNFWFKVRNIIISQAINKYFSGTSRLLEVGCGTGFVSRHLKQQGYHIECADLFQEALNYCRERDSGYAYYQYNLYDNLFFEEFDGALAFDVLEHLDNDINVLKNLNKCLKKDGILVLTVPACDVLWSEMDIYSGHKRRYSKKLLIEKLEIAGFEPLKISYFMTFLFPFIMASRFIMNFLGIYDENNQDELMKLKAAGELDLNPLLNTIFYYVFSLEVPLIHGIGLPFGSSLICVAKKEVLS